MTPRRQLISLAVAACAASLALGAAAPAIASELAPELRSKVDRTLKRLAEWAADPAVVSAVREANGRDAAAMNNARWVDLAETDPAVKGIVGSKVSAQIARWEAGETTINKLFLRDQKGALVAASAKPLMFNVSTRPAFVNAIKGQPWAAGEVRPDPTTQEPSLQVGVPVLDGGKTIGVLHAAIPVK